MEVDEVEHVANEPDSALPAEGWQREMFHMKAINLFPRQDIRILESKTQFHEKKISAENHVKEDYLRYIQFGMDLYTIISNRRARTEQHDRKEEIDIALGQRISGLFVQAIEEYKDDIHLWGSYFKFCKQMGFVDTVSTKIIEMLATHSDNPSVWKFAASWEFEERNCIEKARDILQRALRLHSTSSLLHCEAFRLELAYSEKMRKIQEQSKGEYRPDDATDLAIKGEIAKAAYLASIKMIPDVEFYYELITVARKFSNSELLQNKIFEDMLETHPDHELTWDLLAKRAYEGLPCYYDPTKDNEENMEVEVDEEPEPPRSSLRTRIQKSVDIYIAAVAKIDTMEMWGYYLDHIIELYSDLTILKNYKGKLLRSALEAASNAGKMAEKYHPLYLEKKVHAALKQATDDQPENPDVWETRLLYFIKKDLDKEATIVYQDAMASLKKAPVEQSLKLWTKMYMYFLTKGPKRVKKLFQEGMARGGLMQQKLKPLYIEYVALSEGIGAARREFESIDILSPPCLALLQKMADLESMQPDTSMKTIRRCHELACTHFGERNTEVWMEYIKFELKSGEPPRASQIYVRALKVLTGMLAEDFKIECSKFNVSPVESETVEA